MVGKLSMIIQARRSNNVWVEISNNKFQEPNKFQIPMAKNFWNLKLEIYLGFVFWNLEFNYWTTPNIVFYKYE